MTTPATTGPEWVTVRLEDAQRIFDLAIDTPLVCSGSFETDDVRVLRAFAQTIGVDPALATPEEFTRDFPHAFVPFDPRQERQQVPDETDPKFLRWESSEEIRQRFGNTDSCGAGGYRRRCGQPAAAPVHTDPTYGPTEETTTP